MITPVDLARYRALNDAYLVNAATIARTGTTEPCRIAETNGWEALGTGLPSYARVPVKQIILQWSSVVLAGDILTLTYGGTYYVVGVSAPEDFDVKTVATAVQRTRGDGAATFPMPERVTLTDPATKTAPLTNIPALIYPAMLDAVITPTALKYKWAIWLDPALRYADGLPVQEGDMLTWAKIDWPTSLSEHRPILTPVPADCFYAEAVGGTGR